MSENNLFEIPVLFIIFNRPETEKRVFEQIGKIKPRYLYVAADGPRKGKANENEKCVMARKIIDEGVDWDCEVKKFYRKENMGCKMAVSSAIDWFFNNVKEGIILEDDCLPDLSFFEFCHELLRKYRNNERVTHISGNNFSSIKTDKSFYFSKYPHVWGWATWRRAWNKYSVKMDDWEKVRNTKILSSKMASILERIYWNRIFKSVYLGKVDTWDYQWLYCQWKNNGVSITPKNNLVENIGFKEGTHDFCDAINIDNKITKIDFPLVYPEKIVLNDKADKITSKRAYGIDVKTNIIYRFKKVFRK